MLSANELPAKYRLVIVLRKRDPEDGSQKATLVVVVVVVISSLRVQKSPRLS